MAKQHSSYYTTTPRAHHFETAWIARSPSGDSDQALVNTDHSHRNILAEMITPNRSIPASFDNLSRGRF